MYATSQHHHVQFLRRLDSCLDAVFLTALLLFFRISVWPSLKLNFLYLRVALIPTTYWHCKSRTQLDFFFRKLGSV